MSLERTGDEPSLLISTFRERQQESTKKEDLPAKDQQKPEKPFVEDKEDLPKPVLINDEYFLIESSTDTAEKAFYNMAVTLSFAENLLYLFPSKSLWPPENMPFDFRFNLLGSPVRFQPFTCLKSLTEIGERATAKIKSSSKGLLRFLKQSMQTLTILLCCENIPVAECIIPIKERIELCQLDHQIRERLHLEPVNIVGIFPLASLLETEANDVDATLPKPQMGVVITLTQIAQPANLSYSSPAQHSINSSVISLEPVKANLDTSGASSIRKLDGQGKCPEDLMYAAALELEVWKEEQKLIEQEKNERARTSYMELLNSEYCRQAAVKEAAFQRRVHHVEELEKQLESAIQAARQSEIEFQHEKEHLSRQRAQLAKEKTVIASEVERVTQSLTSKHKFELDAERRRHTEIATELRRKLKAQLQKSSEDCRRISELEQALNKLKQS